MMVANTQVRGHGREVWERGQRGMGDWTAARDNENQTRIHSRLCGVVEEAIDALPNLGWKLGSVAVAGIEHGISPIGRSSP